jgi:hypothetical protein
MAAPARWATLAAEPAPPRHDRGAQPLPLSFLKRLAPFLGPLRTRLRDVFSVDLRTLALFRTCVGLVLFVDMLRRFSDLRAFYTDAGVLPRSWLADLTGPWRFSLHFASGDAWYEALLLAIAALAALALTFGWRTRLAGFVSWLLLTSLCTRNPLILLGGDYLLGCLLFWGMFLPLGARWSVDAALSRTPPPPDDQHWSWASTALILQVLSVYFFGALMKTGQEWWPDGTAVYYTLNLDGYSWPWSHWLLNYPELLRGLTYFVYWLEMLGPLVALTPFFTQPLRFIVLLLLMTMHTGFLLLLAIGFFPFVSLASLTVLLGGWFWNGLERRLQLGRGIRIYYDRDCAPCLSLGLVLRTLLILPRAELMAAQDYPRADTLRRANRSWVVIDRDDRAWLKWPALVALLRRSPLFGGLGRLLGIGVVMRAGDAVHGFLERRRALVERLGAALLPLRDTRFEVRGIAQGVVAVLMLAALAWNMATVGRMPFDTFEALSPVIYPLRLEQFWQMFAPFPFKDNGWYVLPGKLVDGSEVDVLRPAAPLSYDKPPSIALDFPNMRWQVYENRMYDHRFRQHRGYWARYLCREWNRDAAPEKRLLSFNIVYMLMRTPPPGESSHLEQVVLWRHQCVPPDATANEGAQTDNIPSGPN